MEVLFLCGIYPQPYKEEIFKNSKKGYQFAAQNLQEAIVEGFVQNQVNLTIVTVPFLSTFPFGYKKPVIHFNDTEFNGKVLTACAHFINIPFFQDLGNSAEKKVFEWCKRSKSVTKHILVYSLSINLMKIAIKAKENFKDVKISIVVPDLPEYFGTNFLYNFMGIKKRRTKYIYANIKFFDYYILLSEAMAKPLDIKDENLIVMEGIFNTRSVDNKVFVKNPKTKVILYTGSLSNKYGIDDLLAAFVAIPNPEYRLIICGDGEAKSLIQEKAIKDDRIKYLGKVSHSKILNLQKEADLLVNPRTPEGEFTKYSFPSKTMEYFASGTPVLMYRLPGVPREYFKYCYTVDNTVKGDLKNKIVEILSFPDKKTEQMGKNAAAFILEHKNPKNQVNKIINLMLGPRKTSVN